MTVNVETMKNRRLLNGLRDKLFSAKAASEAKNMADTRYKEISADALGDLIAVDGLNGTGVRFEYGDKEVAAFACQPDAGKYWDAAPLIEWLTEHGYWAQVSTTQLDPIKLEAEIASGNIKRADVEKFQVTGEPKKPYVKFINPKPDSK